MVERFLAVSCEDAKRTLDECGVPYAFLYLTLSGVSASGSGAAVQRSQWNSLLGDRSLPLMADFTTTFGSCTLVIEEAAMKRIGLLTVVGMVICCWLYLGATETLINRSGEDASGVILEFSVRVRIISFDEDVFPDQEPTTRSDEITFSGGLLENRGRFRLSWTPTTAMITNIEWMAATSGSSTAGGFLMNDTGQTVYGLQVAFSQPVTLTSYGDVLTSVLPAGESTAFTFSGGEVSPGGSHWLNWEPSSVSLVTYSWTHGSTHNVAGFNPLDQGFPEWERLYGPPGGYVELIEQCEASPDVLYAAGGGEGLYKSTDRGESWVLLPGGDRGQSGILSVDPANPDLVYGWSDGLARSTDGGLTWTSINRGFEEIMWAQRIAISPADANTLYVVGPRRDGTGCAVFRSTNQGLSWSSVGPDSLPNGSSVAAFDVQTGGTLFLGVNDRRFAEMGTGEVFPESSEPSTGWTSRLFTSYDEGETWNSTDYGSIEPRFIWSLFVNPWKTSEVWLSEGPLYNEGIGQPMLFRSDDNGRTWHSVHINADGWDSTQVRVIGASSAGAVYVAAGSSLLVTTDDGSSFCNITPPRDQMSSVDFFDIQVDVEDPLILYLPLRSGGIGYSEDGGVSWVRRDNGIASISANLIEADPFHPATVYVSSLQGQGVYRSDDYGETWSGSLAGIEHPWGDEIVADPHNEGVVWFIADVPLVHRSDDFGDTWNVEVNPRETGAFNFGSIYAIAQGESRNTVYVLDNGFGVFRGDGGERGGNWAWQFLRTTDVDYSYALVIDPSDNDVLYSGYSCKPFQNFAMIRQSLDGGDSWTTALSIEGAEAVTSIDIDEGNSRRVFASSTGDRGGVWRSTDRGTTWDQPSERFDFTTIHSCAAAPSDPRIVYAGIWGGGTFVTRDAGETWTELDAQAAFSAAGIAVDPTDPNVVYIADRTKPVLYRSTDGGVTFEIAFDAGPEYARLMGVTIDLSDPGRVYTIAMTTPTAMDRAPGAHGSLFRIENGEVNEMTGDLPRMPLSIAVHPDDPDVLYAVLHGYGVYISEDGALTWRELSVSGSGLPDSGFLTMIVDPYDSSILYLLGGCDVRFGSFTSAGKDLDLVNGIYRSTDRGLSWECINGGVLGARSGAVKALGFSDEDPDLILAAAENGLYVSEDRGASWVADTGVPYGSLGGVAISGDYVLAMTNGAGVLRGRLRANGAISWESDSVLSAHVFFAQVIVDSRHPGTLFASGYPGGVFKSIDDGATWHEANFGMTSFAVDDPLRQGYYALALAPSNSDVLYLGLYGRGVYKSIDAAGTWMPMNGESGAMLGQHVTGLTIDPRDENRVFVSTENGIFRTDDGGQTWALANRGLLTNDVKTIVFTQAGELYAGTRGYGFYRWTGAVWQPQNPVGQWGVIWPIWADRPRYQYSDMLIHSEDSEKMMFGSFPAGIYVSEDGGSSWRESNVGWTLDGVFSLIAHPDDPDVIYAGTYNGVNRSVDFGAHWEMWDQGWPPEQWVFRIAFDPRDSDVMYACSKNGENEGLGRSDFHGTVMKSTNGGVSWFPITVGLPLDNEFYDIVVDPVNPDVLYLAAQHDGMFISVDAGASWHAWGQGLEGKQPATNGNNVTRVLALSGDNRYLYLGVLGAGVYRREIHPPML